MLVRSFVRRAMVLPGFALLSVGLSACSESGVSSPEAPPPTAPIVNLVDAGTDGTDDTDISRTAETELLQTTASGLQYEVIRDAEGPKPGATSVVTVHYKGTLLDGTEFDSSYSRGEPATFPLQGVIPGFAEGLQLMSVGSHYRFVMPANLAYGERGVAPMIPPGAVLEFEVELLEINS